MKINGDKIIFENRYDKALIIFLHKNHIKFDEDSKVLFAKYLSKTLINIVKPLLDKEGTSTEDIEYYHHGFKEFHNDCIYQLCAGTLTYNEVRTAITDVWHKYCGYDLMLYLKESKLLDTVDDSQLIDLIKNLLKDNQKVIEQYKSGKTKAISSLIGPILKQVKADPTKIKELIEKEINEH